MGPKFAKALPASENASGQTAKLKEVAKYNITGIGLLIRTNTPEDIIMMLESTVSDDWSCGRVDLAVALLDKKFCQRTQWLMLGKSRDLGNCR